MSSPARRVSSEFVHEAPVKSISSGCRSPLPHRPHRKPALPPGLCGMTCLIGAPKFSCWIEQYLICPSTQVISRHKCCFSKTIPTGKSSCRAEAHPLRCLHETSEAEHLTSQCLRPGRISLASHVVSVAVIPTRPIDCAAARRQRARPFFPVLHLALPIQL